VALQQTTRELWAQQGPFEPYTIHSITQRNVPEIYVKSAVWNAQAVPASTAGILQYNPIQSAILQNLIGQIFATELDYIGECPQ
jgi:hypothetical protein